MTSLRSTSRRLLSVLALAGVALTTSCTFGPGDYKVYTLAMSGEVLDPSCYADAMIPDSTSMDTSTYLASGTYYLFAGPEEIFYLDNGAAIIEGTKSDSGYEFVGASTDVEYNGDLRSQTDIRTTVAFNTDGKGVSGTVVVQTNTSCTGGDACPNPTICRATTNFVGAEVTDADIEHQI
ncbi:MAG: hypothetical protein ACPG4T_19805 [Nannocystaceae bacterium]